jgi:hypothetical protein
MKRTKIVLGFLLVLALGLSLSVNLSEAEQLDGLITIQSDGSVVPQTEYIKQEGNVYYLTQNLSAHRLDIYCSNIVLDGQGYTINGSNYYVFGGKGITLENINNVTIRDVMVVGYFEPSISLSNCSNITILRVHTDEKPDIIGDISDCIYLDGNSNGNIISNCVGGVRVQSGSGNTITATTLPCL